MKELTEAATFIESIEGQNVPTNHAVLVIGKAFVKLLVYCIKLEKRVQALEKR